VLLKLAIDSIISGFTGLIAFLSKNCVKYTKAFCDHCSPLRSLRYRFKPAYSAGQLL